MPNGMDSDWNNWKSDWNNTDSKTDSSDWNGNWQTNKDSKDSESQNNYNTAEDAGQGGNQDGAGKSADFQRDLKELTGGGWTRVDREQVRLDEAIIEEIDQLEADDEEKAFLVQGNEKAQKPGYVDGDFVQPLKTWEDVGDAYPKALTELMSNQFDKPTVIQSYVWSVLLDFDYDFIGIAKTGSGKTLAFMLPIWCICKKLDVDLDQAGKPNVADWTRKGRPYACIMTPTRELCCQIYDECKRYGGDETNKVKTVKIHGGGQDKKEQLYEAQQAVHVIVATPGRLWGFIAEEDYDLSGVRILVLDEADRMLEEGFEWDVRKIGDECEKGEGVQKLMFSATFPNAVRELAKKFCSDKEAVWLQLGNQGESFAANSFIQQEIYYLDDEKAKKAKLHEIASGFFDRETEKYPNFKMLVFASGKKLLDQMAADFDSYFIPSAALHGDLPQNERQTNLDRFRKGEVVVLFASEVASRGIDVENVTHVVNFHPAYDECTHVHRIGRTGRAGKFGKAINFIEKKGDRWGGEEWALSHIRKTMVKAGQSISGDEDKIMREAAQKGSECQFKGYSKKDDTYAENYKNTKEEDGKSEKKEEDNNWGEKKEDNKWGEKKEDNNWGEKNEDGGWNDNWSKNDWYENNK